MKTAKIVVATSIALISLAMAAAFIWEWSRQGASDFRDERIASEILGETRVVNIRTPWNYERESEQSYPLIIKFDGDSRLRHHDSALEVLHRAYGHREAIIVAIPNTVGERNRDLTPSGWLMDSDGDDATGSGDQFLSFITDELLPYLETELRLDGSVYLMGYSRGGLFALHGLVERPDIFDGAIGLSPAFWRDDHRIVPNLERFLQSPQAEGKQIVFSLGEDENDKMRRGVDAVEAALREHSPTSLSWARIDVPGDHQTAPLFAIPGLHVALQNPRSPR